MKKMTPEERRAAGWQERWAARDNAGMWWHDQEHLHCGRWKQEKKGRALHRNRDLTLEGFAAWAVAVRVWVRPRKPTTFQQAVAAVADSLPAEEPGVRIPEQATRPLRRKEEKGPWVVSWTAGTTRFWWGIDGNPTYLRPGARAYSDLSVAESVAETLRRSDRYRCDFRIEPVAAEPRVDIDAMLLANKELAAQRERAEQSERANAAVWVKADGYREERDAARAERNEARQDVSLLRAEVERQKDHVASLERELDEEVELYRGLQAEVTRLKAELAWYKAKTEVAAEKREPDLDKWFAVSEWILDKNGSFACNVGKAYAGQPVQVRAIRSQVPPKPADPSPLPSLGQVARQAMPPKEHWQDEVWEPEHWEAAAKAVKAAVRARETVLLEDTIDGRGWLRDGLPLYPEHRNRDVRLVVEEGES